MGGIIIHPFTLIFSVCICLRSLSGSLELILLLRDGGSQGWLEQFLPDDLSTAQHVEIGINTDPSIFIQVLDWLYLGRVPFFVSLIIFLTIYSLTGFIIHPCGQ